MLSLVLFGMPALGASGPGHIRSVNAQSATPAEDRQFHVHVNGVLQQGLDDGLTGISVAVHREGRSPVAVAVRLADRENETPLAPSDRFRASIERNAANLFGVPLIEGRDGDRS